MSVIHKKCGTKLESSGMGDYGVCPKCKIRVDHLIRNSKGNLIFSDEVIIKWD